MEIGLVDSVFDTWLSDANGYIQMNVSKTAGPNLFGVVTDGQYDGYTLSLSAMSSMCSFPNVTDVPGDITFMAVQNSSVTVEGSTYTLQFNNDTHNLGHTMIDNQLVGTSVTCKSASVGGAIKKKQILSVTLVDGRVLNRDGTMRALDSWLNNMNSLHAGKHGVTRIVWCNNNRRPGGALQRTFMQHDLKTKRQKPCANASAAIELMKKVTGCDFYEDMRLRSHLFELEGVSVQPGIPVVSARAATGQTGPG